MNNAMNMRAPLPETRLPTGTLRLRLGRRTLLLERRAWLITLGLVLALTLLSLLALTLGSGKITMMGVIQTLLGQGSRLDAVVDDLDAFRQHAVFDEDVASLAAHGDDAVILRAVVPVEPLPDQTGSAAEPQREVTRHHDAGRAVIFLRAQRDEVLAWVLGVNDVDPVFAAELRQLFRRGKERRLFAHVELEHLHAGGAHFFRELAVDIVGKKGRDLIPSEDTDEIFNIFFGPGLAGIVDEIKYVQQTAFLSQRFAGSKIHT